MNLRTPITSFAFLLGILAQAQPTPFGCHYFRHAPGAITWTAGARDQIDETIARSEDFDILHYDIDLDVTNVSATWIKAATTITFVPLVADRTTIRFDLFQLQVDSIVGPDGPVAYTYDDQFIDISFPVAPTVGEAQSITVYYQGVPFREANWGGFYFESGYAYNLGIGLSTIPPNFGKVWYPCFDSFVERATFTYHVKSAGSYRFHGQGDLLGEEQLGGDTLVRTFHLSRPIPTHVSAIAVAAYQDHDYVHSGANGDVPVRLTAKANNLPAMVEKMADLGSAIDACEHWYGPNPFDRVGYVITTDGALEIPTNIAYPQFILGQSVFDNQQLFAHELGHHWWGDNVTPHVHNEMWLKEGPAEYSGHLLEEWIGGRDRFIKVVKDNHLSVMRSAHINDGGYQPLSPMPDEHIYGTHTYYKGASVMHNLRGYMGDELFQQALRGIQQDQAGTNITSEGFKEALEAHSGLDLDPFFDAWVFAPGFSVFDVRDFQTAPSGGQWSVAVEIGQKLLGTTVLHEEVPLTVTCISEAGVVDEQQIMASGLLTNVELTVPFDPVMVVLNRGMRLNQARMDNEITLVPNETFINLIPYVDFRVFATSLVDSTLVRIEHVWCGPDQLPLAPEVLEISGTHYWHVDGLWPEGTELQGRLYYFGAEDTQFDHDLVAGNEYGMALLYRRTANDVWEICPDQVLSAGSLTNGSGYITFSNMQKGQYCFGKIAGFIGLEEVVDVPFTLQLMPVPATDVLTVAGTFDGQATFWWDVFGTDGRLVQRTSTSTSGTYRHALDVSSLAAGSYVLRATEARGGVSMERRFEVIR